MDEDEDRKVALKTLEHERAKRQALAAQLAESRDLLTAAQAEVATLQGAVGNTEVMAAEIERLKGLETQWGEERAIMTAGITEPEGIDFARMAWARLAAKPEGGIAAWMADRANLARGLRAYLPTAAPAAPAATSGADPTAPAPAAPAPAAPAAPAATSGATWDPNRDVRARAPANTTEVRHASLMTEAELRSTRAARFDAHGQSPPVYAWSKKSGG